MIFVDTNYFLRLILSEISLQHKRAKKMFESAAAGKIKLFTSVIVFFEIYWVLTSFYKKNKKQIIQTLDDILKMDFILFEQKEILVKMLKIFKNTNFDLEDCYNLVYAKEKNAKDFKTFDKKLGKKFAKNLL